ncbi:hypothetical protein DXG01_014178 [Tephrocybe rancida]|nr:hypothetical protein DXG01_014178 [Tephrocybe rancida]
MQLRTSNNEITESLCLLKHEHDALSTNFTESQIHLALERSRFAELKTSLANAESLTEGLNASLELSQSDCRQLHKKSAHLRREKSSVSWTLKGWTKALSTCRGELQAKTSHANTFLERLSNETECLNSLWQPKLQDSIKQTSDLQHLNGILIKCLDRANTNVSVACSENKKLTWHARKSGVYTIECQSLARKLLFGESSDVTTHRKTTMESTHITLSAPTYEPDADDTDCSTWSPQVRFVSVAPAIDHTAKSQFTHSKHLGELITSTYSNSPLATCEKVTMETEDYI